MTPRRLILAVLVGTITAYLSNYVVILLGIANWATILVPAISSGILVGLLLRHGPRWSLTIAAIITGIAMTVIKAIALANSPWVMHWWPLVLGWIVYSAVQLLVGLVLRDTIQRLPWIGHVEETN